MLCGTDGILQNIPHIQIECEEYSIEYRQSAEHCYGCEQCYDLTKGPGNAFSMMKATSKYGNASFF